MTLEEAIAQRDAILENLGVSKSQYQGRSIEYPTGEARIKELAYLEDVISRGGTEAAGSGGGGSTGSQTTTRCTYGSFKRG